jgi:hypothetical protein
MLSGPATVALLGDSTGSDDTEWFRTTLNSVGTANPKAGINCRVWNDATKTYPVPTTIQAGTQDGIYVNDTFTRTGALIASLPDPLTAGSVVWRDAALPYLNGMKPVTA